MVKCKLYVGKTILFTAVILAKSRYSINIMRIKEEDVERLKRTYCPLRISQGGFCMIENQTKVKIKEIFSMIPGLNVYACLSKHFSPSNVSYGLIISKFKEIVGVIK